MELMFDDANLETLKEYTKVYPSVGVTCNPTIIKKEGKIDFFNHFKKVREMIGHKQSLHIQVVSQTAEEMVKEAERLVKNIDENVYVKIPSTKEGFKAMRELKAKGFNITATAIYTKIQGLLAISAGADYLAPYFNRIERRGESACEVISALRKDIDFSKSKAKILAASFHSGEQVIKAIEAGADAVTLQPKLLDEMVCADYINEAIVKFAEDWEESQEVKTILDCE